MDITQAITESKLTEQIAPSVCRVNLSSAIVTIFQEMAKHKGGVLAIEGRAAAGKTTFASQLAGSMGLTPVQIDDFFLPPELRTPERLATPGGNVHHERFAQEVLPHLQSGQAFQYRKFDCTIMDYNGMAEIVAHPWRIVEGVYSLHPALGDYATIRIFIDVTPEVQEARIKARNSPQMVENYLTKWIPMEEAYFGAYKVQEGADIVLRLE